jgi:hypothetical protein
LYINEGIAERGTDSDVPLLVKLCYRLLDLHNLVWKAKDLIIIRDYCFEFRRKIEEDMSKETSILK